MTVQELVDWCAANNVDLNTQIALRAKDDYLLTGDSMYLDKPYFGNCREGSEWVNENAPKDEDGCPDIEKLPDFLVMDTFFG
jgi:hypothetical protein